MSFRSTTRKGPDALTEELVTALLEPKSFEFKALFLVIYEALQIRHAVGGGEDMLRLRAYDKLQGLVRDGRAKKNGKQYRGVRKSLLMFANELKAMREEIKRPSPKRPSRAVRKQPGSLTWD